MNIAIIPARGGSTRIPRKNIKSFHGNPMISYSIETALKSGLFDEIIVSTDDGEIAGIAMSYGATDIYKRTPEMSVDEIGTQEVARDVLLHHSPVLYACVIYPCSPMLEADDIRDGFVALRKTKRDYAYSVDDNCADCGNYYWGIAEAFINKRPLSGSHIKRFIPRATNFKSRAIDINTHEDWAKAEQMYGEIHGH